MTVNANQKDIKQMYSLHMYLCDSDNSLDYVMSLKTQLWKVKNAISILQGKAINEENVLEALFKMKESKRSSNPG